MQENLKFIDNWLKENANKIYELSLNPPAQESQLAELEQLIGKPLPEDFKELYRWHNGLNHKVHMGSLFYGYDFWDLDKVIERFKCELNLGASFREKSISYIEKYDEKINLKSFIDNPSWLQFCHDGSRTGFYLDLNPSSLGIYGQVIFIDDDYNLIFVMASSITELVSTVAEDMKNGKYQLSDDYLEDDEDEDDDEDEENTVHEKAYSEHILEVDYDIDILNRKKDGRWAMWT